MSPAGHARATPKAVVLGLVLLVLIASWWVAHHGLTLVVVDPRVERTASILYVQRTGRLMLALGGVGALLSTLSALALGPLPSAPWFRFRWSIISVIAASFVTIPFWGTGPVVATMLAVASFGLARRFARRWRAGFTLSVLAVIVAVGLCATADAIRSRRLNDFAHEFAAIAAFDPPPSSAPHVTQEAIRVYSNNPAVLRTWILPDADQVETEVLASVARWADPNSVDILSSTPITIEARRGNEFATVRLSSRESSRGSARYLWMFVKRNEFADLPPTAPQ